MKLFGIRLYSNLRQLTYSFNISITLHTWQGGGGWLCVWRRCARGVPRWRWGRGVVLVCWPCSRHPSPTDHCTGHPTSVKDDRYNDLQAQDVANKASKRAPHRAPNASAGHRERIYAIHRANRRRPATYEAAQRMQHYIV